MSVWVAVKKYRASPVYIYYVYGEVRHNHIGSQKSNSAEECAAQVIAFDDCYIYECHSHKGSRIVAAFYGGNVKE